MADSALSALYKRWEDVMRNIDEDGNEISSGPTGSDPAEDVKIDPKDITCSVGAPLTEEEFRNRNRAMNPRVVKA